jgi:carbon storage regulator
MLIIQRRVGERIVMSNGIEITVAGVTKRGVRLAMNVPDGIVVLRGEVHDAVAAANAAAAATPFEALPSPNTHPQGKSSCNSTTPGSVKSKSTTRGSSR